MNNPLTIIQLADFERELVKAFREKYQRALKSGAFPDSFFTQGNHQIAKIVAATFGEESFAPVSDEGKKALRNYKRN